MVAERRRTSIRTLMAAAVAAVAAIGPAASQARAQMDLGVPRPGEPPATRHAETWIETRLERGLIGLDRARGAAESTGAESTAIDVAEAIRRITMELAGGGREDVRVDDEDLVLAAKIVTDLAAWDAMARTAIGPGDPAPGAGYRASEIEPMLRRFVEDLDDFSGGTDPRARLVGACRSLLERLGEDAILAWAASEDARIEGDPDGSRAGDVDPSLLEPAGAAAALDAAIRAAAWLRAEDALLEEARTGAFDRSLAPVVARAAEIVATINEIEPKGRARGPYREALESLDAMWPEDEPADRRTARAFARGWSRLAVVVDRVAASARFDSYTVPRDLPVEVRRLFGLLRERAEAAERAVMARITDLIESASAASDPDLVSLVAAHRTAIENLGRLEERNAWIERYRELDPELAGLAATWIDQRLLRLGAPARRAEAARDLRDLGHLLARLERPPGFERIESPDARVRSLLGGRSRQALDAWERSRRERLALAVGGPATAAAASTGRWLALLALIDTAAAAGQIMEDVGPDAASVHPSWHLLGDATLITDEAARAIDIVMDRTFSEGAPPPDAIDFGRRPLGPAAAWRVAVPSQPRPEPAADAAITIPDSLIAAIRSVRDRDLAAFSRHACEARAAAQAGDEDAAEAHRDLAIWIAATAFDPTIPRSPLR